MSALLLSSPYVGEADAAPVPDQSAGPAPDGSLGVRLLEAPVSRRDDSRALTSIVDHLSPGTTITRRFEVSNTSSEPMHVEVYSAAATIAKGTLQFAEARTPNELSGWISVDEPSLDLLPHESRALRATIEVPQKASAGERYAVVWAQVASKPDSDHTVVTINRVGVRVYLDVGPGGEAPSDFSIGKLVPGRMKDGRPQVEAVVHNTGKRALDLNGTLSLSDGPGSMSAGPFTVLNGITLAPDESGTVVVPLDRHIPAGVWTARLKLASGPIERSVTGRISFSGDTDKGGLSLRWWLLLIMAGGVALIGTWWLFIKRRRKAAE